MSRATPIIACKDALRWVSDRIKRETGDKRPLAMLTGQDARALTAFAHLLELYVVADDAGRRAALDAMRAVTYAMQRKVHPIAKATIPWALDWNDEDRIWRNLGWTTEAPASTP